MNLRSEPGYRREVFYASLRVEEDLLRTHDDPAHQLAIDRHLDGVLAELRERMKQWITDEAHRVSRPE